MKTTDIPNGYVVLGPGDHNILVDFDDDGKAENKGTEVSITGWPAQIMQDGLVLKSILVLVHSVRGSDTILVKRLFASQLTKGGQPVCAGEIAKHGLLAAMAEKIRREYMTELEKHERKLAEKEGKA